jgi:CelD/BcsL family acetyltransferase involved in cellulose biosynthesis
LTLNVYEIDPCKDPRWRRFLDRHPDSSVFHTPEWLESLRRTYDYQPVVYTTSSPASELVNGQVFCRVNSWITGRRLVSVPFSDHAALLVSEADDMESLLSHLKERADKESCQYIEIRPVITGAVDSMFQESGAFHWHKLLLDADIDTLYHSFHKSCVQRKIRRAVREKLEYTEGRSDRLIRQFHQLLVPTQQRHGLPPQPIAWFQNLSDCLGENLKIRIASKDGAPIAAMITLAHKQTMVYKYGCSDAKYHNLGGMAFLFWKTIQEAKRGGFAELDMGRSDLESPGLIKFKEHWGADRTTLKYWRYSAGMHLSSTQWELKAAKKIFSLTPSTALATVGRLLYRHVG